MTDAPLLTPETAARWRALRPALPLRPGVAAAMWAVAAFLAVMSESTSECTPASPCGADWVGAVSFGILALAVLGTLLDPALGAVAGAVLAPLGLWYDAEGGPLVAVAAAFGVAGLLSVASAVAEARSRHERLALLAHGTPVQVPDEVLDRPLRTARLLLLLCGGSLLVAAALGGWVASNASDERARQRRAPVVDATVVAWDESDMEVTLVAGGRRHTIDAYGAYEVGETVPAWELGDGLRLVGEPYDASFPGVLPILALALALVLARRAAHVRAEVRALRLGAPAWTVSVVPTAGALQVVHPGTFDAMVVVPVDVEAVGELLWPGQPDDLDDDLDEDVADDDYDDLDEDDEDEELAFDTVVVAGRLVPRGLVAVRVGEQWIAPLELARTAH